MKEIHVYLVEGTVNHVREEGFYEAYSERQACYRFGRDRGLSPADDVPGLSATKVTADVNDKNRTFYAANNGYLD